MSPGSTLREELEKEIGAEVDSIRRRAAEQGESLVAEAERWERKRKEEAERHLSEECDLRSRRALARAELEQRNALLRRKREELDKVFQLAMERLADIRQSDTDSYSRLMGKVFENCRNLLPRTSLRVRLGPGLEDLERRLAKQEEVTVESDGELFGILVEADKGRVHCDITIPRLLGRLRREREAELEDVLFGDTS